MRIGYFVLFIFALFFLETALLPGLFTEEISLHISLLLFLAFMYQAWPDWMIGFLVFILALPFFTTQAPLALTLIYAGHVLFAYFLTQSLLGARSFSSFLVYALIISFTLSCSTALLFETSWKHAILHFFFSFFFLLIVKTLVPIRVRTFLSGV